MIVIVHGLQRGRDARSRKLPIVPASLLRTQRHVLSGKTIFRVPVASTMPRKGRGRALSVGYYPACASYLLPVADV
jgi:hypothetical protein